MRWAPNLQTVLAVVTNENIKIYDFSRDIISPIFNFKVLASSFVDCAFAYDGQGQLHLLALTAEGCIFVQERDSCFYFSHFFEVTP